MRTVHVYFDESGDLNFSNNGSQYYVFTAAWTFEPRNLAQRLNRLRFQLLKDGHDVPEFHATDDNSPSRKAVLNGVLQELAQARNWWFCAVVVEKAKVDPLLHQHLHIFYSTFATMPLRFVFSRVGQTDCGKALVFTDRIPVQGKPSQELAEKTIKIAIRGEIHNQVPFHVYHHHSSSNYWLQIVDYCSWSVFRKWEKCDTTCYDQLLGRLAIPEKDVLAPEPKLYY